MTERRFAILIDGSNLYATQKELGIQIDYKQLLSIFPGEFYRALYFTAIVENLESPLIQLLDFIEYNGWTVIKKFAKVFKDSNTGRTKIKGNMDMEMAIYALQIAPHVHDIYLFSGDGDFQILVQELQRVGVRVHVVSSMKTNPPMVADNLRRQADEFIELTDLRKNSARPAESSAFRNRFIKRS